MIRFCPKTSPCQLLQPPHPPILDIVYAQPPSPAQDPTIRMHCPLPIGTHPRLTGKALPHGRKDTHGTARAAPHRRTAQSKAGAGPGRAQPTLPIPGANTMQTRRNPNGIGHGSPHPRHSAATAQYPLPTEAPHGGNQAAGTTPGASGSRMTTMKRHHSQHQVAGGPPHTLTSIGQKNAPWATARPSR